MLIAHDPPGYSQPSLPPEPARQKLGVPLIGGGLLFLAGLTVAAYVFLPHGEHVAAAAAPPPMTVPLASLADPLPESVTEGSCTPSTEKVPVVLRSAIDALRTETPSSEVGSGLFLGLAPASEPVSARRVAVLRTIASTNPAASHGEPTAGRYEGALIVFDAASRRPLCQTRVLAWSSSTVVQPGISQRALHDDFAGRIHAALAQGASRLRVDLDL